MSSKPALDDGPEGFLAPYRTRTVPAVDVHNPTEVKYAIDDFLRQAVELQYAVAPSHTATDLHLFAGYAASLLACGGAGYNYYYPASRGLLAACIVGYFVFMAAMVYVAHYLESNILIEGTAPSGAWIVVRSDMKRYDTLYTLSVEVGGRRGGGRGSARATAKPVVTAVLARPVTDWMDWDGFLVIDKLLDDLKASLAEVGLSPAPRTTAPKGLRAAAVSSSSSSSSSSTLRKRA